MTINEAYEKGFKDALKAFSYYKNGEMYVGTAGCMKLKDIERNLKKIHTFKPPEKNK
jgi:hypothetical protein